jgi:segregation and condensation protein B
MNRVLRLQETLDEAVETADAAAIPAGVQAAPEQTATEPPAEELKAPEQAEGRQAEDEPSAPAEAGAEVIALPGAAEEAAAETELNPEHLRMTEALLFAASEPLSDEALKSSLPEGANLTVLLQELKQFYESRGVNLVRVAEKWQFRTAPDLAFLLRREKPEQKRLSRAAIETLAIIAYHQPVTRAEVEDIRGVMLSKGTLDTLMEIGWVKIRGRKRTPGRPVTYGTTEAFLVQFGLENIGHLPGMDELKAAGFLEAVPPAGLDVPAPSDQLGPDEDPYEGDEEGKDLATGGADPFMPGS